MEYIQSLFVRIQEAGKNERSLNEWISFLDKEPLEYRSVAYESASMVIGIRDLLKGNRLNEWIKFYHCAKETHSFHMEIGLGWAFAKSDLSPVAHLEFLDPPMRWMVFDGMGYYHGLFKGRRTIIHRQVPDRIIGELVPGFDQGLGRRLWYRCKGEGNAVAELIQSFPEARQGDLWRGIGIATGYVGGNEKNSLKQLLLHAAGFRQQLSVGIALAALSRTLSGSVTEDIKEACKVICGRTLVEVLGVESGIREKINSKSDNFFRTWMRQLEEEFS